MSKNRIHPQSFVQTEKIGPQATVRPFSRIYPTAVIGRRCSIGEHCSIENDATVGDDVVIKNGVSICEGVTLENRVYVGPNVVFTFELAPRAPVTWAEVSKTVVCEGASLGPCVTVHGRVIVGRYALVDAGSVVVQDVPDFAQVAGNPAQQVGWVCACGKSLDLPLKPAGYATCSCGRSYVVSGGRVIEKAPAES